LLATPHLTFISVWNPSFLTLLMDALEENFEPLLGDVKEGTLTPPSPLPPNIHAALCEKLVALPKRAQKLQGIFKEHGTLPPAEIWPRLRVISCWADAGASFFIPELQRYFPGVEIQPKGLLATEGVVSLPLTGHPGAALAITSHFFEFLDEEKPDAQPLLADELDEGSTYSVLLTTGGGLYRYRLGDRVRVVGRAAATPLVEFVGRSEDTSDLCGEKLHEAFVRGVLHEVLDEFRIAPLFAMLAPEWGTPPGYVLFLEAMNVTPELMSKLVSRLEEELFAGTHYAYCRRLGQLSPLRGVRIVSGGNRGYLARCARMGQRLGNIKPTALHRQTGWSEWYHAMSSQTDSSETK
ncbi:MAG TPA: GH3 auxin-responsive promoter family protein, partial [Candidatus Udaeobacter sp.]|nr:GH3 auxin-responsive promoter family protein [Candidatus Udaeobacter sp.]